MTDPEPDTPPDGNSAAALADIFVRKFREAVDDLDRRLAKLTPNPPNQNFETNKAWVLREWSPVLYALLEAADFYRAVRDRELSELELDPFEGLEMVRSEHPLNESATLPDGRLEPEEVVTDARLANLISSKRRGQGFETHYPVLDFDFPVQVRPSRTRGHYHVILRKPVGHEQYMAWLESSADAGLLEPGFVELSKLRGASHIRMFPTSSGWRNEEERNNTVPKDLPALPDPDAPQGDWANWMNPDDDLFGLDLSHPKTVDDLNKAEKAQQLCVTCEHMRMDHEPSWNDEKQPCNVGDCECKRFLKMTFTIPADPDRGPCKACGCPEEQHLPIVGRTAQPCQNCGCEDYRPKRVNNIDCPRCNHLWKVHDQGGCGIQNCDCSNTYHERPKGWKSGSQA